MANFDAWITDPDVKLTAARNFAQDPSRIGERFGAYTLVTTSGTTGEPGIFLIDDGAMRVTNALMMRMVRTWLSVADLARIVARGRRLAMVADLGHHSATSVAAARIGRSPSRRKRLLLLSVQTELGEIVRQLNEFQPAVFAPYASLGSMLAAEQDAGRLRIHPVLTALAAEGLPVSEYGRIAASFDTKVGNSYAATECPFLSFSCEHNWLHINADWVILEPVDNDLRPVPPGTESDTVLISNLANRVQPILRYNLGDRVLERPDPCPCGSPLPAIRVQGRSADVLRFTAADGRSVAVAPLAFELDHVQGLERAQVVQDSPTGLRVRLRARDGADAPAVWNRVRLELEELLAKQGLGNVAVEPAPEPPERGPGAKFRPVVVLAKPDALPGRSA